MNNVWEILKSPVVTEKSVILKEDSPEENNGRKKASAHRWQHERI